MSINLSSLVAPSTGGPLIFTIVADGGMGKTTLGSLFPDPIFIRTEDGTQSIASRDDVALFPVADTVQDVLDAIESLVVGEHMFKTLVIDSVTKFNQMVEADVLASDPKARGLNQALGGYGNAYDAVAKAHQVLRKACSYLATEKGMNIVFLAHATTETIDPPDGDAFTRYSIPMHKKSIPCYTNDVDVVAFIKQKTFTSGEGAKKKAVTDGSRIITCYPTPNHVSKNRLGIKEDLVFIEGENPFESYLRRK
jgi:hypothetical protein